MPFLLSRANLGCQGVLEEASFSLQDVTMPSLVGRSPQLEGTVPPLAMIRPSCGSQPITHSLELVVVVQEGDLSVSRTQIPQDVPLSEDWEANQDPQMCLRKLVDTQVETASATECYPFNPISPL